MHKSLLFVSLVWAFLAHAASAQPCPDRYRFVDFGIEGSDAVLRRGGTIFRAFDPANKHLLLPQDTVCQAVQELAKDGRYLPIPVVSAFSVDVAAAGLEVSTLGLRAVADVMALAEENARSHRRNLRRAPETVIRGETFVCAQGATPQDMSCQILSPYKGNIALVVYCDAHQCDMPVWGRDTQIVISGTWLRQVNQGPALGAEITAVVNALHTFLEKQFSGF